MAEAADPQHRDEIARPCAAVAQGTEGRDAGAKKRSGIFGRQFVRDRRQRFEWRDHVIGITAVIADPGNLAVRAGDEIAPAAGRAVTAMTAMPADADPLARLPVRHVGAHRIDDPDNLVSRYARVSDAGEGAQLGERIAVAHA